MPFLQDIIHKLEVGGGRGFLRYGLFVLAVLMLGVVYNWRSFRNMGSQEAMDAAQLARNISEGKGYNTLFIRPFSMYLLKRHSPTEKDAVHLKSPHPDLANPPVYPVVLAGLLKVAHFNYEIPSKPVPFWTVGTKFARYKPDFVIAMFNEVLMLINVVMVFFLARKLFDPAVAWLSTILMLGTELFWRFSVSGLSTNLLLIIFTGLLWCVVLLEEEVRAPKRGANAAVLFTIAAGVLAGLGGLTRYSFGWLIIPLLIFLAIFGGPRKILFLLIALASFAIVLTPWIVRNVHVSGTPFGTAGYSIMESTQMFPDNRLPRSLDPDLGHLNLMGFWMKLIQNLRQIAATDLPKMGGTWVSAFFLVGLLVVFRNPGIRRVRYFLLMALGVLIVTQALGRTQLSEESPEINTENLLVLVTPMVIVFGTSLFFLLLEQITLPLFELRYLIMGAFGFLACLPLIFTLLPPKTNPLSYPPYYPPACQVVGGLLNQSEIAMSDVPWAVAWYGDRKCVWLTLKAAEQNTSEGFFSIYDTYKAINVLYLTPETLDARFLTQWIRGGEQSWGSFVLECLVKKKVPEGFPLSFSQPGWLPEQLILADWERWSKPQADNAK
jgi:hypothetical protein